MIIVRLIILLAIVALLMWLLKRLFTADPEPEKLESDQAENIKQCKYCGVHVPESAIVTIDGDTYCCREHADLDKH